MRGEARRGEAKERKRNWSEAGRGGGGIEEDMRVEIKAIKTFSSRVQ